MYGSGERAKRTAASVPVLSSSPTLPMMPSFLVKHSYPYTVRLRKRNSLTIPTLFLAPKSLWPAEESSAYAYGLRSRQNQEVIETELCNSKAGAISLPSHETDWHLPPMEDTLAPPPQLPAALPRLLRRSRQSTGETELRDSKVKAIFPLHTQLVPLYLSRTFPLYGQV